MILDGPAPRVLALPLGADFAASLLAGLEARLAGAPPEAWGRVTILVPTRRMHRRLADAFDAGPPRLLPRLRLVTDVALDPAGADLPPPVPALRRRLELSRLVAALLAREPDLAPRARLFDLSDSLADLMEEMQGEGVPPSALAALDLGDLSGHWDRALRFLRILEPWFDAEGAPDGDARIRRVLDRLEARWDAAPPRDPVIVAGATAARGPTARLMALVARLPRGAVVLPGFDPDLPDAVWDRLDDPLTGEDHPQFLHAALLRRLGLAPADVRPWVPDAPPPGLAARRRLVSLSLRPPPVTDQWLAEGPTLGPLAPPCDGLTLVEAPTPRAEAETIALAMRAAIAAGETAALVTPDRGLARMVAAALDRWGVAPDDSAGQPLPLSPPGRLLRQVADLLGARPSAEALLALLKHPLAHAGGGRAAHLRRAQDLELALRRDGPPQPDADALRRFAARRAPRDPGVAPWADWVAGLLDALRPGATLPLAHHVARHLALAEALALGPAPDGPNPLWQEAAGREARALCDDLARHADAGGPLSPADYASLFQGVLATAEVRERDRGHPRALILGTLEARAQGADLVILGGMNDGVWPPAAPVDPWLNRRLRQQVGLPLPERRIGQAALDYQMALAAPRAWLTRARRDHEAPTVPSRWLNRLLNLVEGLPAQGGAEALGAMRARGDTWLAQAAALARPDWRDPPAPRPAPRPPLAARPRRLSVTAFDRLRRDPYALYAEAVLRLRPLNPLTAEPDPRLRGTALHRALEVHLRLGLPPDAPDATERLLATAAATFEADCPWPVARRLWLAALGRAAPSLLEEEAARRATATPTLFEQKAEIVVEPLGIVLVGKADRIDLDAEGRATILDYKSGKPPTAPQQKAFSRQLLLLAAMAERGAFGAIGPVAVAGAAFVGIGTERRTVVAPLAEIGPDQAWADLVALLAAWMDPARGYASRIAVETTDAAGDYDHLARYGEWDQSMRAETIDLD